jgi:hypothetical protein
LGAIAGIARALVKVYRPAPVGPAQAVPVSVDGALSSYGPGRVRRRRFFRDAFISLGRVRKHRGRVLLECPYCGALGTSELFPARVPTENISLYTRECPVCDCLFRIPALDHRDRHDFVRGYVNNAAAVPASLSSRR